MRYRDYKNFHQGGYFHLYNRGNNKQPIFLDQQDYDAFLKRLIIALGLPKRVPLFEKRGTLWDGLNMHGLPENSFCILSYCLMPNHFHFLIRQNTDLSVSKLIGKVCTSYSMYFNRKYERVGSLFQDQFKSKHINSDSYLTYVSAYIHNNPINPEEYKYSSFSEYLDLDTLQICDKEFILDEFDGSKENYKKFVLSYNKSDAPKAVKNLYFD